MLHVAMWLFYGLARWYLQSISFNPYDNIWVFVSTVKQTALAVLVFYPLVYYVWPRLFLRKRYFSFAGIILLLIIMYGILDSFSDQLILARCEACMEKIRNDQRNYYNLLQRGAWQVIFVRIISLGIVYEIFVSLALPLTIKVMVEYITARIEALELQKENIKLEFNFLKSQVNPHFLFNTLNNIYALILKDRREESAETVARLSTFLRYSLYETESDLNPAGKEIELIRSYVALEKIRLNDTVVNFSISSDREDYLLPPLLFIPALENAFKFCAPSSNGDAYIFISLAIKDHLLEFAISNTFDSSLDQSKTPGGIGLSNLRKRLSTQFPGDRHSITTRLESNVFSIIILIKLAA